LNQTQNAERGNAGQRVVDNRRRARDGDPEADDDHNGDPAPEGEPETVPLLAEEGVFKPCVE